MKSPSAIVLSRMCLARAVAAYGPAKLRGPDSASSLEGKRLHTVVQAYLRDGTAPSPLERAAHAAISVLPTPAGSVHPSDIERVVQLPGYFGYVDFETPTGVVGDLKFTGNLRYQKEVDPTQDPQRIIYANDAFYRDPYAATIRQSWVVAQFNGASSVALECGWTRKTAKRALQKYVEPVAGALDSALEAGRDWNEVEKNYGACHLYPPNGCHLKQQCKRPDRGSVVFAKPKL